MVIGKSFITTVTNSSEMIPEPNALASAIAK